VAVSAVGEARAGQRGQQLPAVVREERGVAARVHVGVRERALPLALAPPVAELGPQAGALTVLVDADRAVGGDARVGVADHEVEVRVAGPHQQELALGVPAAVVRDERRHELARFGVPATVPALAVPAAVFAVLVVRDDVAEPVRGQVLHRPVIVDRPRDGAQFARGRR